MTSALQAAVLRRPIANFPVSSSVQVRGNVTTTYLSGEIPPIVDREADPSTSQAYGDTQTQTAGILGKIQATLEGLGLGISDVVKMQVFLVHTAQAPMDFRGFMQGYAQFFGVGQPQLPARSVVGVSGLANPGWLVEIEVVAVSGAP